MVYAIGSPPSLPSPLGSPPRMTFLKLTTPPSPVPSPNAGSPRETNADGTVPPTPEWQKRAEQLVLYVRALQLLSSALTLAKNEKALKKLQPSSAVKSGEFRKNLNCLI